MAPRPPVLSAQELDSRLERIPAWEVRDGGLWRRFVLTDFAEAFAFMTRVAAVAEELDHHPDWSNSWNSVEISILSHDAGGITDLCVELASRIDAVL
ncbi:MAG: 4a-hydroxytetrahydrobiopterin dehydratase [Acidobacteria bacterium]|nr:4a-hydroxytetrahydrobiopterin dehydratase [Acidobacteriota bacterium]